eukprot:TRINITY_DN917_c0_g1_i1.p1 TRINITY_DN917_c0_g1~~TRINITY_DN917_c0_g1_i1.p1  ORF type:complete len:570 (-),score=250.91 TRINITY_DN917_c0_g1_i1:111-1820(-)
MATNIFSQEFKQLAEQLFNNESECLRKTLRYGTSGFRSNATKLNAASFACSCVSVLRSTLDSGKATGLVITASHNPEEDNGLKIVDTDGGMLVIEWEPFSEQLLHSNNTDHLLNQIQTKLNNPLTGINATVLIGRDTRSSSSALAEIAIKAACGLGACVIDLGVVTTPIVHSAVRNYNDHAERPNLPIDFIRTEKIGHFTNNSFAQYYIDNLVKTFSLLALNLQQTTPLIIDGSNGVGSSFALQLGQKLKQLNLHDFTIINDGSHGKLNYMVGADFVKAKQSAPNGVDFEKDRLKKFCSLDGDADRLIYFFLDEQGHFHMLDGDKIATLYAIFIIEQLNKAGLQNTFKVGVVQTAYANGASTRFLTQTLGIEAACEPTGVKYLHTRASNYDVGIYFEANGHGTILFSENFKCQLNKINLENLNNEEIKSAIIKLQCLPNLINQSIGDPFPNLLLIEAILRYKQWSLNDWNVIYSELPNRQRVQRIADKSLIKTYDAERRISSPIELQEAIDNEVSKFNLARSFVRPSGTEDVVRVYSEADTQQSADQLALNIAKLVFKLAQGAGEEPKS